MLGDLFSRRLGDTDCEAFRSGFFAQPANVTSSFAFVIVGGAFAVWALRQGAGRRLLPLIYAGFIAANGVGGMLFHGPAWTGSAWIHDLALVGSLVFILLYDVRALRPMTTVQFLGAGALILAVLGMTLAGAPQTANLLNAVFGALVLGTELVAARERYAYRKARQAYAVLIAALVVGVAANLLGRTGGPLCHQDSLLQGHALWHVCTAIALGAWGVAAMVAGPRPASERAAVPVQADQPA